MQIGVKVMPKNEVLDSQGRAVEETLKNQNLSLVECRVGKYIILDIDEKDRESALDEAKIRVEKVLYNPLIETYELEILGE